MSKSASIFVAVFAAVVVFLGESAWAQKEKISQLVPDSKIIHEDGNEFEVLTSQNTAIEIEFNKDGTLDEAEGKSAINGDVFNPGNGLVSLKDAASQLTSAGKTLTGEWSFEQNIRNEWVYEFEGRENNNKMKYISDAKTGKMTKERRDW